MVMGSLLCRWRQIWQWYFAGGFSWSSVKTSQKPTSSSWKEVVGNISQRNQWSWGWYISDNLLSKSTTFHALFLFTIDIIPIITIIDRIPHPFCELYWGWKIVNDRFCVTTNTLTSLWRQLLVQSDFPFIVGRSHCDLATYDLKAKFFTTLYFQMFCLTANVNIIYTENFLCCTL